MKLLILCYLILLPSLCAHNKEEDDDDEDGAIARFREYLRIPTAHPHPHYDLVMHFLHSQAHSIGLEARSLEFVTKKPVSLLTWRGKDISLGLILLNSHTDVVPAEKEKWVVDPFSAYMDESGNIYGRGSQDMKCVGMMYLEAIRRLKKEGFEPLRSLHLSFVPDEEVGGEDGAKKFVDSSVFQDLNVEMVMDEGMASPFPYYRVFHGEKSAWWLVIKALGSPGHGSNLYDNSAAENLLKSLESITRFRHSQFDLMKAGLAGEGDVVSVNPVYINAGIHTPDGFVMNVQPSEAEAGFDIRVPPLADFRALEKRIMDEWAPTSRNMTFEFKVKYPLENKLGLPLMTTANGSNPWWSLLQEAVAKAGSQLGKPEIFPAATDARYIRYRGLPALGLSPMANTQMRRHDHNEYLNKQEYLKGVKVYEAVIKLFTTFTGLEGSGSTNRKASHEEVMKRRGLV